MIYLANFNNPKFFVNLYKAVKEYTTIWLMEDGNMYRSEHSAVQRAEDKEKLAVLNKENVTSLRWIRIDLVSFPKDYAQLQKMFDEQELSRKRARQQTAQEVIVKEDVKMSDEEILAEIQKLSEGSVDSKIDGDVLEVYGKEYSMLDLRKAFSTVLGKSLYNAKKETIAKHAADLNDEQKAQLIKELGE